MAVTLNPSIAADEVPRNPEEASIRTAHLTTLGPLFLLQRLPSKGELNSQDSSRAHRSLGEALRRFLRWFELPGGGAGW